LDIYDAIGANHFSLSIHDEFDTVENDEFEQEQGYDSPLGDDGWPSLFDDADDDFDESHDEFDDDDDWADMLDDDDDEPWDDDDDDEWNWEE
jgi:hypothetical protein